MSTQKESFSTIEEFNLSAFSRGISPGELAKKTGISWKSHDAILTEDGIFHFFLDGMEVDPPDSLTDISEISKEICDETTEKVVIPSSVTSIGDYAFGNCTGLTNVTIPDSVTSVGEGTFSYCSGLTSVTIPDSVTRIEGYAFYGCSGLTSVTIPDSVTEIREYVFSDCTSLTSVTIPDSVTSIGDYAFFFCTSLTSVAIPSRVTSIGEDAFYGCVKLKSITIPRGFENDLEEIGIDLDKTKVSFSG